MPKSDKRYHILGTSANLLGICFVLITGLKISNLSVQTLADEICFLTSFIFLLSCALSYLSIRSTVQDKYENWADYAFLTGILGLFCAMITLVLGF